MTYEFLRTLKGKNDECYTERYAVEPLLDYLEPFKDKIIWCPFDDENSEFVKVFKEYGYKVIFSHIKFGQDYYKYQPDKFDIIISNPPFTNKTEIFKRALSFDKPFALLMTLAWLNDAAPAKIFKDKNIQILSFDKRMQFKNQSYQKKINFMSGYFCHRFLPRDLIFSTFRNNREQMKLL